MSDFKQFVCDEEASEKKRKKVVEVIAKVVKKYIVSRESHESTDSIIFKTDKEQTIRETQHEVIVTLDYYKKFSKGMKRAIYVNIIKETVTYRDTNYITIEVDDLTDVQFMETLESIKNYFKNIVDKK